MLPIHQDWRSDTSVSDSYATSLYGCQHTARRRCSTDLHGVHGWGEPHAGRSLGFEPAFGFNTLGSSPGAGANQATETVAIESAFQQPASL